MTKIVDPDSLNQATEVVIDTAAKTVQLLEAGALDNDPPGSTSGVTMQALYSFLKEEWKDDDALNKFRFPLKSFTKNEFQWINEWEPADATSRLLIRDAGWEETKTGATQGDLYAGMISLGQFDNVVDQGYYTNISGLGQTALNFDKAGNVNEAVLVNDASGTDFTGYFKAFLREQGKLYASYDLLGEQGIAALEPTLYRFPLGGNTADTNALESDVNIDANAPYTSMAIKYYAAFNNEAGDGFSTYATATVYPAESVVFDAATSRWFFSDLGGTSSGANVGADVGVTDWVAFEGERDIGGTWYAFTEVIDGAAAERGEIYEWAMRQLRKTADINTGTITDPDQDTVGVVNGNIADDLATFRGFDLIMAEGVYIDNFGAAEINNIKFVPIPVDNGTPVEVNFPFEVVVTLNLPANVVAESPGDMRGVAYFTNDDAGDNSDRDFNTSLAIIVQDNLAANVDFDDTDLTGNAMIFSYDYDANVQRGAASGNPGTVAPVTLQLVGLAGFEIGTTAFDITRVASLAVNVVAADERNFSNPP